MLHNHTKSHQLAALGHPHQISRLELMPDMAQFRAEQPQGASSIGQPT